MTRGRVHSLVEELFPSLREGARAELATLCHGLLSECRLAQAMAASPVLMAIKVDWDEASMKGSLHYARMYRP